jgi:integrase
VPSWHCGVRVSELVGLTVESIERDRQQVLLKVRTGAKGGKPRNVPIPRRTLVAVDAYLEERADLYGSVPARSRLFVRDDGSPLTQQVVDRTLRRLAASAGVSPPEGAMAHALRHTYGMDLAMRGVPLSVIQQPWVTTTRARHRSTPSPTLKTSQPHSPKPARSDRAGDVYARLFGRASAECLRARRRRRSTHCNGTSRSAW